MPHDHVNPLRIADEVFRIASTIECCPKTMMLREWMMTGREAARAGAGAKRVALRTQANSLAAPNAVHFRARLVPIGDATGTLHRTEDAA